MKKRLLYLGVIFVFVLGSVAVPGENVRAAGTIALTTMGTAYTQDFNTLASTGTTNSIGILDGWYLAESGGSARDNGLYGANDGTSNVGDTYSYGAGASPERALGGLRTTSLMPLFGASFTNDTGSAITALEITYTGEEWRLGTVGRTDRLNFEYSTNATSLTTGTWTGISALDFITPGTVTTGAKDGNATGNRAALSAEVSDLSIPNGTTFWIRWSDVDASGADDGLAIDDFRLMPSQGNTPTDTTISLTTAPNPSLPGEWVTLTAMVSAIPPEAGIPTGFVQLFDNDIPYGDPAEVGADGAVVYKMQQLSVGDHHLTITYLGNGNFNGSSTSTSHHVAGQATLSVSSTGTGRGTVTGDPTGINCGSDCSETYMPGTVVTLTAAKAAGSKFAGWSGDADCSDGVVTLNTDMSCIARFDLIHGITDFDGDGDTDLSVYKVEPWGGMWYMQNQSSHLHGESPNIPVSCDYNGDGMTDVAIYTAGIWNAEGLFTDTWGDATSVPLPADYDGDGSCELAVYKVEASAGVWYIQGVGTYTYGNSESIPVPADYNNDGATDLAVYNAGTWYVKNQFMDTWGDGSSIPLPGDYDGDGTTDLAVFKVEPWAGAWYIQNMGVYPYGNGQSIPVPADYNNDGITDIAVYNAGEWYVKDQFMDVWGDGQSFPLPVRDTNGDGDPYQ